PADGKKCLPPLSELGRTGALSIPVGGAARWNQTEQTIAEQWLAEGTGPENQRSKVKATATASRLKEFFGRMTALRSTRCDESVRRFSGMVAAGENAPFGAAQIGFARARSVVAFDRSELF